VATPLIELITTALISASSVGLFAYWFRYTNLLILSAKTAQDYAASFAHVNQLSFLDVQAALQSQAHPELDRLREALDRDFARIAPLLNQMTGSMEESSVERRMLTINYRLMGAWYRVSSSFSPRAAQQALQEMSMVVAHFANSLGECVPSAA
jgi:hypothetical protein